MSDEVNHWHDPERLAAWKAAGDDLLRPFRYPVGNVVGACACGSWPGGPCLKCPPVNFYTAEQLKAAVDAALTDAVDAMLAAVMNGELLPACEDASDWLERRRAAIRKGEE